MGNFAIRLNEAKVQRSKLASVHKRGEKKQTAAEGGGEKHLHNSHALLSPLFNQCFFVHFLPIKVFQTADEMKLFQSLVF